MKKQFIFFVLFFMLTSIVINAQDLNFDENIRRLIESGGKSDTIKQGANTETTLPDNRNRSSQRDEPSKMSEEALYWSKYAAYSFVEFGPNVTYKDTVIVNPLFMPPVFKPGIAMPEKELTLDLPPFSYIEKGWEKPPYKPVKVMQKEMTKGNDPALHTKYGLPAYPAQPSFCFSLQHQRFTR